MEIFRNRSNPLTLAFQTQQLINTPARIVGQVQGRLDAFNDMFNGFVTSSDGTTKTVTQNTELYNTDMYASASVDTPYIPTGTYDESLPTVRRCVAMVIAAPERT